MTHTGTLRTTFLRSLAFIIIATALLAAAVPARAQKYVRPNIILILADDLGYGDLSCYGQKKFKTPNIDRLAKEGRKFTDFYSGSTVCAPARCSLMTGLHTGHAQVRGNREVRPEGQAPMKAGTVTIPTLLKKAGYTSGMFGKWGLGAPGSTSDPMVFFDEFFGYNCQRQAHNFYPKHLWHNKKKVPLDGKTYSHDLIMKAALNFIKVNGQRFLKSDEEKPFFCYMPVTIPHAAMHAPKELHDKYRKLYPQFENKVGKYAGPKVQNPIAAFAAMMEHLDNGVGQVLDLVKKLGIDKDTIILFTSDNGPHREGGHNPVFWDSNGPFKGFKRDLYDGGIRVPLLARWPGTIKPGTTSKQLSALWDFMPTFCDMARVEAPDGIDGRSILANLKYETENTRRMRDYLYWEFAPRGGSQAIRYGRFKAVRRGVGKNPDAKIEFYDIEADPGETTDVADKYPLDVKQMKKYFTEARTESKAFPLFKKKK